MGDLHTAIMSKIVVAAFYKFTAMPDFAEHQAQLHDVAVKSDVFGTILLAHEGVNGTIAGPREGVDAVLGHLKSLPGCAELEWKESYADENPFLRMKVRLKKEIVTMGLTDIAPEKSYERYVEPYDWNKVISDPETLVIDTRNDYEVSIGAFDGAIDPQNEIISRLPRMVPQVSRKKQHQKSRHVLYWRHPLREIDSVSSH